MAFLSPVILKSFLDFPLAMRGEIWRSTRSNLLRAGWCISARTRSRSRIAFVLKSSNSTDVPGFASSKTKLNMCADKTYVELNNGLKMPIIGLGTWQGDEADVSKSVQAALHMGYRHIDTAYTYKNEKGVGFGLKEYFKNSDVKREDVFVVTKLPVCGMRPEHVEHFLKLSLKNLDLDYVDLYLVHCPFGFLYRDDDDVFPLDDKKEALIDWNTNLPAIWKTMEEMVDLGLTKSIGVSNFSYEQIERIMKGSRITPVTNQVECHAYLQQKKLHEFCKKHGITITAYAPIGSPGTPAFMEKNRGGIKLKIPDLLGDPTVKELSKKYNKAPAAILLRFLVQKGIIVIPKSCTPSRIKENFEIMDFTLSPEDFVVMEGLDRNGRIFTFDFFKGMANHPEHKKWVQYNDS